MERDEVSKDEERVARSYALVPFPKQSINHMRECQTRDGLKGLDFRFSLVTKPRVFLPSSTESENAFIHVVNCPRKETQSYHQGREYQVTVIFIAALVG